VHEFTAHLEGDASLEYMPDHLIPSPGARLRQRTEVSLDAESTFIGLDAWAVGRIARGERWCFDELDMSFVIRDARGLLLGERARLTGARPFEALGGAEGCAYLATFVAIAPSRTDWSELADEWLAAIEAQHLDVRCGVTPLARGGLLARLLCGTAPTLHQAAHELWSVTRLRLLGLNAISLRKL
jgi:urease accessory protein